MQKTALLIVMLKIRTLIEIRNALQAHQRRLNYGESLKPFRTLADAAGVHRDTIYSVLNGNRISAISQIRISRMLDKLAEEPSPPSRLMKISLSPGGPRITFGYGSNPIFYKR